MDNFINKKDIEEDWIIFLLNKYKGRLFKAKEIHMGEPCVHIQTTYKALHSLIEKGIIKRKYAAKSLRDREVGGFYTGQPMLYYIPKEDL